MGERRRGREERVVKRERCRKGGDEEGGDLNSSSSQSQEKKQKRQGPKTRERDKAEREGGNLLASSLSRIRRAITRQEASCWYKACANSCLVYWGIGDRRRRE